MCFMLLIFFLDPGPGTGWEDPPRSLQTPFGEWDGGDSALHLESLQAAPGRGRKWGPEPREAGSSVV